MCKVENGFYWLIYFHSEHLSAEKIEDVIFQAKHCLWADTVLKCERGLFWNLLYLTKMHSVEDRKWFLVVHLLSVSIFDCSKLSKCCFLTKTITLSGHSFDQWALQVLDFTWIYREVCFASGCCHSEILRRDRCYLRQKMAAIDFFSLIANVFVVTYRIRIFWIFWIF